MTLEIPRKLVDYVLLGPPDARRQLQDSPILGDVWSAFAQQPTQARDLLITPDRKHTASDVAVALERSVKREPESDLARLPGVLVQSHERIACCDVYRAGERPEHRLPARRCCRETLFPGSPMRSRAHDPLVALGAEPNRV